MALLAAHSSASLIQGCSCRNKRRVAPPPARAAQQSPPPEQQRPRLVPLTTLTAADATDLPDAPWNFGFQCNERYLEWDSSSQAALSRLWLAQQLEISGDEVDACLAGLSNLLPDLVSKLLRTRADLLLRLARDPADAAARLVALRGALPRANVSELVSRDPALLLELAPRDVAAALARMRALLPPNVDAAALAAREPALLRIDLAAALAEVARILPPGSDAAAALAADPSGLLDMDALRQPSSIEVDGATLQ